MRSAFLNLLFPPQCLVCRAIVERHGVLCASCWAQVHFIAEPLCARCGHPFDFSLGEGSQCGACIQEPPLYAQGRACFRYDAFSRRLVLAYKYADETQLTPIYADWLLKAGSELIAQVDVIAPVPMHPRRFLLRRYNQAALLARALSKRAGLPVMADALVRRRATRPQAGLTRAQRKKNLQGAFRTNARHAPFLRGKNVLLIDDVATTGTTLKHCTKALLNAGAKDVFVLTLARRV